MSTRSDVSPDTLGIELREEGIVVTYADDREAFYHGVPTAVEGTLRTAPGKQVQVLVTDPTETEGVMIYINDLNTHHEILESTGVGRVVLDPNEKTSIFPGVIVRDTNPRVEIEADPETARGRVFVFAEDEISEQSYELVAPSEKGEANEENEGEEGSETSEGIDPSAETIEDDAE
ncbi:hypothetical protein BRC86_10665 [Halobacteriales archaeon QS_3_64_16]|nr:MAG: hypothetical protein BRC86_10665 [Halobacteriales archaeon QS_3_64_16]